MRKSEKERKTKKKVKNHTESMSDIKRKASLKKKKSPFFQTNWVLSSWNEYRVTFIVGEDGNG